MNSDLRVILIAEYAVGTRDYSSLRESLVQKAWCAVRAAMELDCYLVVNTFPGWKNVDDTMQFAPLLKAIEINTYTSICYQLNRSPIEDLISNDPASYAQEELCSPKLLAILPELLKDKDLHTLAIWVGECDELPNLRRFKRDKAVISIQQCLINDFKRDMAFLID